MATRNTFMLALFDGIGETITPTANFTPVSGYPLTNLKNSELFSRTRTPDLTTDRQLTWDWTTAITANVFGLFGTNASLSTLRRFRAADNSGFTTNVIESGSSLTAAFDSSLGHSLSIYAPPWGRSLIYVHPTTFSKRYTRWHQTDSTNVDGYMEWGIARLGLGWQPTQSYDIARLTPKLVGSPGSQKYLRGFEVTFSLLSRADAMDLESFAATSLQSRRFLAMLNATDTSTYLSEALWCTLESEYTREPVPGVASSRFKVVIVFREVDQ